MKKRQAKVLPTFATEEEEIAFWDNNDIADWIEGPADIVICLKKRLKNRPESELRVDEA